MPTIKREGPYRLFFASSDFNEPPHVHVQREKFVAKFWLNPVALAKNRGFSIVELNRIAKLVERNELELLRKWNEFFGVSQSKEGGN